jgi:hypothetical protein
MKHFPKIALALLLMMPCVQAQVTVTNGNDFNQAINEEASSIIFAPSTNNEINTVANTTLGIQGSVTYTSPFPGVIDFNTTINGNGYTLTGSSNATPLFLASSLNETATGGVTSGATTYTVSISNLGIAGGVSEGGIGDSGGAGLGGGLFVGTGYQVTLNNVSIVGNFAIGGASDGNTVNQDDGNGFGGGGGGLGGDGDFVSGENDNGGGGLFANAPTSGFGGGANGGGGVGGLNGGFGGGGATSHGNIGGNGGFGGGGADGSGNGGFGGGGGDGVTDGNGGFGGGGTIAGFGGISTTTWGTFQPGGAGSGFGGGIFVQNGASVLLTGNDTIFGNLVIGGTSNAPTFGNPVAAAAGADIFIMSGSSVTLAPGTGNTIQIGQASDDVAGQPSDVADDSTYSITGTNLISTQGSGPGAALTIGNSSTPGGLVILHGNNTYAGGTTISNGVTLEVFQDDNLGAYDPTNSLLGSNTVSISGAELLTATNGFVTGRSISITGTAILAAASNTTASYIGTVTGTTLIVGDGTNNGTVVFTNNGNVLNNLGINGATLSISNLAQLGGVSAVALSNNGALLTTVDGFTTSDFFNITGSGTLAAGAGTTATYSGQISGGALSIGSATSTGNVILLDSNTYTGGTSINGGTLKVEGDSGLGAQSDAIAMAENTTLYLDFSGTMNRNVNMNGSALLVTDGNTVTITGSVTGSDSLTFGDGTKANDGTVVLTGTNTNSGNVRLFGVRLEVASGDSLGHGGQVQMHDSSELVTLTNGSSVSQNILLDTTGTLAAAVGTSATYNGNITGFGDMTIGDAVNKGTVFLNGSNSYLGDTLVSAGSTLEVADDRNLGSSGDVRLDAGAELLTDGAAFSTSRTIDFTSTGTLAAVNDTTATYDGTVSGTFSIGDSTNHGTVNIGGNYTGNVAVNGGAFSVTGTLSGNVAVNSGGQVGGSGTINGKITVASGGSTYPGDPQILTASSVEYQSGSTAQFSIATTGSSPHPPTAGTDYDQMSLTGSGQALTIDSGTTTLQLNLSSATLAVLQNNANNNILDNYFLFALGSGTSSGMFSDLTLSIDGTSYTAAITDGEADFFNLGFDISYTADSTTNTLTGGHDVAVEVVEVVPEPSTYALLVLGLGVLLLGYRTGAKRQR